MPTVQWLDAQKSQDLKKESQMTAFIKRSKDEWKKSISFKFDVGYQIFL